MCAIDVIIHNSIFVSFVTTNKRKKKRLEKYESGAAKYTDL